MLLLPSPPFAHTDLSSHWGQGLDGFMQSVDGQCNFYFCCYDLLYHVFIFYIHEAY